MDAINWNVRCCSHLRGVLDLRYRKEIIRECIEALKPHANKFEAIAVSGYSMALIAPSVADALGKGLIIVRKEDDNCASNFYVEGTICSNYIIIDDLVCSKKTFRFVQSRIAEYHHSPAKLYGIYLYDIDHSAYRTHTSVERYLNTKLLNAKEE